MTFQSSQKILIVHGSVIGEQHFQLVLGKHRNVQIIVRMLQHFAVGNNKLVFPIAVTCHL
ncbi:hypothetical protein D3C77_334850 [compost metagenome]